MLRVALKIMFSQNIAAALFAMMVFASQGASYAAALLPAVPALPAVAALPAGDAPAIVPLPAVLGLADLSEKLAGLPVEAAVAAAARAAAR